MNDTVTLALFQPKEFAPGDLEPLIVGNVLSMLTPVSVVLAELPARSTHAPGTDWFAPSPRVVEDVTADTPDKASLHVKLTVTGPLFQPFELGGTDLELVMIGCVRSTLILVWELLAEFPALSMHVPVTDWPPPSPRFELDGVLNTPERASVQVKLTVTVTLFQPLVLAPGDLELVIRGAVLSMLIPPTVAEDVLPALSVQLPLADWLEPSEDMIDGLEGMSTPDRASLHV